MMSGVAHDHVGQGPHAERDPRGRDAAQPGLFVQVAKQRDTRLPDKRQFGQKLGMRIGRVMGVPRIVVLLEAGQRRRIATGGPQGAIGENAARNRPGGRRLP